MKADGAPENWVSELEESESSEIWGVSILLRRIWRTHIRSESVEYTIDSRKHVNETLAVSSVNIWDVVPTTAQAGFSVAEVSFVWFSKTFLLYLTQVVPLSKLAMKSILPLRSPPPLPPLPPRPGPIWEFSVEFVKAGVKTAKNIGSEDWPSCKYHNSSPEECKIHLTRHSTLTKAAEISIVFEGRVFVAPGTPATAMMTSVRAEWRGRWEMTMSAIWMSKIHRQYRVIRDNFTMFFE